MPAARRPSPSPPAAERRISLRGAVARLMRECRAPEVVIDGPYGTGKTRGILEYVHRLLLENPGTRWLLIRKTLVSLTNSALVTYRQQVLQPGDARFFGGAKDRPAAYEYGNGSILVVGGMDKPDKVLSTEYDGAYVVECNELLESEWEVLSGRLRHGRLPFQQLIGDCNPQGPLHWLKRRADRGQLVMLSSRHADNPAYHDGRDWTPAGRAYIGRLQGSLTGVRRARGLEGRWVAAEGVVYEGWDDARHHIPRFVPPKTWTRYWAVDFGYTNPFVCQFWAEDPDGRLYLYRELYQTQRLVEDHAVVIRDMARGEPPPAAIICDHDAEDRATLERKLGLLTVPAYKNVAAGIQAVAARLRPAGDGRPRLFIMRDACVSRDSDLVDVHKPAATVEEIDGYVWDTRAGQRRGDVPLKENDHGMDAMRYLVAFVDSLAVDPADRDEVVVYDEPLSISPF